MSYRRRKKKKRLLLMLVFVLLLGTGVVFKYNDIDEFVKTNLKAKKTEKINENEAKVVKDGENEEAEEVYTNVFAMNDYIEQPSLAYKMYENPVKVKGIYVKASRANGKSSLDSLVNLLNTTELNSMVIDVKDDNGTITYKSSVPMVNEVNSDKHREIKDIGSIIQKLEENNIFPIARIVCFKDPYLSKKRPELAIKNKDGSLFYYKNVSWLNPYNKECWKYIIDVAKEAVEVGFKEIQFDYIRFEATSKLDNADFGPQAEGKTKIQAITEFAEYAMKELKPYGAKVSADVFGTIITSHVDAKRLGQEYIQMAEHFDVLCPMIYPSHYGKGFFGIPANKHSDLYPYETIKGALEGSNRRYEKEDPDKEKAIIRPWLQAFTASYLGAGNWKTYGAKEIRDQIQATYDAGMEEWILWNAGSKYSSEGMLKE